MRKILHSKKINYLQFGKNLKLDWCLWPDTVFRGSYNDVSTFLNEGINVEEVKPNEARAVPRGSSTPTATVPVHEKSAFLGWLMHPNRTPAWKACTYLLRPLQETLFLKY